MKKMDIKDNVDEMILKICKYIEACDLSDIEDSELKIESAMTLFVSAIDFTDDPIKNLDYIIKQQSNFLAALTIETTNTIDAYIHGDLDEGRLLWF